MSRRATEVLAIWMISVYSAACEKAKSRLGDTLISDRIVDLYTYGAQDGDPRDALYRVTAVAFDDIDNLYILDAGNSRVVVVSPDGDFLRQFGRQGSGPGEMRSATGLAVTTNGNVVVNDNTKQSFLLFSREGNLIDEVRRSRDVGILLGNGAIAAGPENSIILHTGIGTLWPGADIRSSIIVQHALDDDDEPAVLFRFPPPEEPPHPTPAGALPAPVVFRTMPKWAVLPSGKVAVRVDHTYTVSIIDPASGAIDTISRDIQPHRVTHEDQERWRSEQADAKEQSERDTRPGLNVLHPAVENAVFAEYIPLISAIGGDQLGRLWIKRYSHTGDGPIDLFDQSGRLIGTLPSGDIPNATSASGRAAYIVKDGIGIERVHVRQLPPWR